MCLIVLFESTVILFIYLFYLKSPFAAILTFIIHSTPWQRFLQLSNVCCWKRCIWLVKFTSYFPLATSVPGRRILVYLVHSQMQAISHLPPFFSLSSYIFYILFSWDNHNCVIFLSHWCTLIFYNIIFSGLLFITFLLIPNILKTSQKVGEKYTHTLYRKKLDRPSFCLNRMFMIWFNRSSCSFISSII